MEENIKINHTPNVETPAPEWALKLQEEVAKLKADNAMLRDMAGKNTIASWEDGRKDKTQKFAYLKRYDDKIVVGWGKLDYSEFNRSASDALSENIFMNVQYLGGGEDRVNYINFKNCTDLVNVKILHNGGSECLIEFPAEVVSEFKLSAPTLAVASKFLNA
jgi:hypothetical protein